MKKVVAVLVTMLIVLSASGNGMMVQAASEDMWEIRTTETVLSEIRVIEDDKDSTYRATSGNSSYMTLGESYIEKELKCTHDIYVNESRVFSIDEICTVWYYSDGMVHLYRRTLTGGAWFGTTGIITYGSIVNTDGSYSYTSGDKVIVTRNSTRKIFALDFYVTASDYDFSMYEIN